MTDTTNTLLELIEAAEGHLREYAGGQRHNDEGRRYKATQRLRAAIALATAQPEDKPEGVDWPEVGSVWLHTNGNRYTVTGRANDDSTRADYPPVVLYRGEDGRHWAKPLAEWHRSRTLITPPAEAREPVAGDAVRDDDHPQAVAWVDHAGGKHYMRELGRNGPRLRDLPQGALLYSAPLAATPAPDAEQDVTAALVRVEALCHRANATAHGRLNTRQVRDAIEGKPARLPLPDASPAHAEAAPRDTEDRA